MARLIMVVDANKCINCKACLLACRQRNSVFYPEGRNWIKENLAPSSASGWHYQPGGCMQCDRPQCVEACPTGATYKAEDAVVYVNQGKCVGCGACLSACPYLARHKDMARGGVADKCDYCLPSRERGLAPACVSVCPTRARIFGDVDDPGGEVARILQANAEKLVYVKAPGQDTKPSLVYLEENIPTDGQTGWSTDWPRVAEIPLPMRTMRFASAGVSWLSGLVLLGLGGVFLKNLLCPPDLTGTEDKADTKGLTNGAGIANRVERETGRQ